MDTIKLSVLTGIVCLATVTGELVPRTTGGGRKTRKAKAKTTTKKKAPAKKATKNKKPARARKTPAATPTTRRKPAPAPSPAVRPDRSPASGFAESELRLNMLKAEAAARFPQEFWVAWKELSSKNPSANDLEFFLVEWEGKERPLKAHFHEKSVVLIDRIKKMVRDEIETLSHWYWRGWRWAKSTAGWAGKAAASEFESEIERVRQAGTGFGRRKIGQGIEWLEGDREAEAQVEPVTEGLAQPQEQEEVATPQPTLQPTQEPEPAPLPHRPSTAEREVLAYQALGVRVGAWPHEVIGVRYDARGREIDTAQRRLRARFHPDQHPEYREIAPNIFGLVGEAAQIMKGAFTPARGEQEKAVEQNAYRALAQWRQGVNRELTPQDINELVTRLRGRGGYNYDQIARLIEEFSQAQ